MKFKKDTKKPEFTNKATTYRPIDMSSTTLEGFRVLVNCVVTDNSINNVTNLDSSYIYYPIFYEVEINKEKFLSYTKETIFDITSNICSWTFTLKPNIEYIGTIRIMDLSGNFSLNLKKFPFYTNK